MNIQSRCIVRKEATLHCQHVCVTRLVGVLGRRTVEDGHSAPKDGTTRQTRRCARKQLQLQSTARMTSTTSAAADGAECRTHVMEYQLGSCDTTHNLRRDHVMVITAM